MIYDKDDLMDKTSMAGLNEIVVSNEEESIIGTLGLATCFGIVLYNRKNKWGMVGHATPDKKIEVLEKMIKLLPKDKKLIIEYKIVPGYDNVENKDESGLDELELYLYLNAADNIELIPFKTDLKVGFHERTKSYEFAFDVVSGLAVGDILFHEENEKDNEVRI